MVGDYGTSSQDLPHWLIGTTACVLCAVAWAKVYKLQMKKMKVQHTMAISVFLSYLILCFKSLHIAHVHPVPSVDPVKPCQTGMQEMEKGKGCSCKARMSLVIVTVLIMLAALVGPGIAIVGFVHHDAAC